MKWSTAFKIIALFYLVGGGCFAYEKIRDRWVEAHRPPPQTKAQIQADVDRMVADSKAESAEVLAKLDESDRQTNCDINATRAATYRLPPTPGGSGFGAKAMDWDRYDQIRKACIDNASDPNGKYVEYHAK